MDNVKKHSCGVVIKSHPKSHIIIVSDDDFLYDTNPKYDSREIVILQVALAHYDQYIVEFVYKDEYDNDV